MLNKELSLLRLMLVTSIIGLSGCGASSSDNGIVDESAGGEEVSEEDNTEEEATEGESVVDSDVVRFILIGDSGSGSEGAYAVGTAISKVCESRGCDFVLGLGDNIYESGVDSVMDDQFEEKFELPFAPVEQPFYFVLGNHDNSEFFGGDGAGNATGEYQIDYHYRDVEYPEAQRLTTRWNLPERYYRFNSGEQADGSPLIEFFAIDSTQIAGGFADSDKNYSYSTYGKVQAQWLNETMTASKAKWKMVFAHHPYVSNGSHGNAGNYDGIPSAILPVLSGERYKDFLQETTCDKADFLFAGHDHDMQWLEPQASCGKTEFIVSGAGSKTRSLVNRNENPVFYQKGDQYGFVWVEIKGDQFVGEVYQVDPEDEALGLIALDDPQPAFTRKTTQSAPLGLAENNSFTNPLGSYGDFDLHGQEGNLDPVQEQFKTAFDTLAENIPEENLAAIISTVGSTGEGLIEVFDSIATGVQGAATEQDPEQLAAGAARATQSLLYSLQELQMLVDTGSLPAPFDQLGTALDAFKESALSNDEQGDLHSLTDPLKALAMNIQGIADSVEEETGVVPVVGGAFSLLSELLLDVGGGLDAIGNADTSELSQVLAYTTEDLLSNLLLKVVPIEQFAPESVTNAIKLGPHFLSSGLLVVVGEVTYHVDDKLGPILAPIVGGLDKLLLTPIFNGLSNLTEL